MTRQEFMARYRQTPEEALAGHKPPAPRVNIEFAKALSRATSRAVYAAQLEKRRIARELVSQ